MAAYTKCYVSNVFSQYFSPNQKDNSRRCYLNESQRTKNMFLIFMVLIRSGHFAKSRVSC